jgi:cyclophilin family peptidyl-prolyl cis-trans isomerase
MIVTANPSNRSLPLCGGVIVPHYPNTMLKCVIVAICVAIVGCGRSGDDQAKTASINGTPANKSQAGGSGNYDLKHPVVLVQTSVGNFTLKLDGEKSQLTVDNFCTYVKDGFYDNTIVHQVYRGQGIVAGGYGPDLIAKKTHTEILNEADNGLKNLRATISMVRVPDQIHSATSQFFINVADNPILDHRDRTPEGYGYCVFGTVAEGMDVVDRIANATVRDTPEFENTPSQMVVIQSVRLIQ